MNMLSFLELLNHKHPLSTSEQMEIQKLIWYCHCALLCDWTAAFVLSSVIGQLSLSSPQ